MMNIYLGVFTHSSVLFVAGIFGCLIGLRDSVTAITFVALGTSLPDLFASKQAATMERYADNSIGKRLSCCSRDQEVLLF